MNGKSDKVVRGQKKRKNGNGRGRYKKQWGFEVGGEFNPKTLAIKANAKANYALSMLNTEKKYIDTLINMSTGVDNATGNWHLLNPLGQGTSVQQRVGDQVRFVSGTLHFSVRAPLTTTPSIVRIMVLKDVAPNGATLNPLQVLNTIEVNQFRNLDFGKRFVVYSDKCYTFSPYLAGSQEAPVMHVKEHLDLSKPKNKGAINSNVVEYGISNTGTIADISTGAFWILAIGNQATSATVSGRARMRFIDN